MLQSWVVLLFMFSQGFTQFTANHAGNCGGNFDTANGYLTTPNYGSGQYPPNTQCRWNIKIPKGKVLKFEFLNLDIEADVLCIFDGVVIFDSMDGTVFELTAVAKTDMLLGKTRYCGRETIKPIVSKSNDVIVIFYSDDDSAGAGFKLKWEALNKPDDEFDCDFEKGLCTGWTDLKIPKDDFDWTLSRGATKTVGTGPTVDHTLQNNEGLYIFIESSSPQSLNDTAILSTPPVTFNKIEEKMCIQFWYHMYGKHTGKLEVGKVIGEASAILWSRVGEQGLNWRKGNIELEYIEQPFQIIFKATRGAGFTGDIAIDDVKHYRTPCSHVHTNEVRTQVSSQSDNTSHALPSPNTPGQNCSEDEYQCKNTSSCIPMGYKCDGFQDCHANDDEIGCDNTEFALPPIVFNPPKEANPTIDGMTIANTSTGCRWSQDLACDNGACVAWWNICDGVNHCQDGKDEVNCPKYTTDSWEDMDFATDWADTATDVETGPYIWPTEVVDYDMTWLATTSKHVIIQQTNSVTEKSKQNTTPEMILMPTEEYDIYEAETEPVIMPDPIKTTTELSNTETPANSISTTTTPTTTASTTIPTTTTATTTASTTIPSTTTATTTASTTIPTTTTPSTTASTAIPSTTTATTTASTTIPSITTATTTASTTIPTTTTPSTTASTTIPTTTTTTTRSAGKNEEVEVISEENQDEEENAVVISEEIQDEGKEVMVISDKIQGEEESMQFTPRPGVNVPVEEESVDATTTTSGVTSRMITSDALLLYQSLAILLIAKYLSEWK